MLGLAGPVGGVVFAEGGELAVVGWFNAGELLAFLDGSLLEAADPDHPQPEVRAVHVLARRPEDVAVLTRAVLAVLGADDPGSVAVETSEARAAVAGELGRFGRRLVTVVLGVGLVLAGLTVYGSESSRRRDFGRRRALGAGRLTVVALVVLQTLRAAVPGAAAGTSLGVGLVWRWAGSPPGWEFISAVGVLAILAASAAALPPALVAAYRDPIRVLRVP